MNAGADTEIRMDILNGFLTRYAHRVTGMFDITVRCDEKPDSYYKPVGKLIVVGGMKSCNVDLVMAKSAVLHECGHALYTPGGIIKAFTERPDSFRYCWNLLEDGRIELILLNSVPRAQELLAIFNERCFSRSIEQTVKSGDALGILWGSFWQLAKLGELRIPISDSCKGELSAGEIRNRVEKSRKIIAAARYRKDPWKVIGDAEELWELIRDIAGEGGLPFVSPPQVTAGDGQGRVPDIRIDIGGEGVPSGMEGVIEVIKTDGVMTGEKEREIEDRIRSDISRKGGESGGELKELEVSAGRSLMEYGDQSRCRRFVGSVRVIVPKSDINEYERIRREISPVVKKLVRSLKNLSTGTMETFQQGLAGGTVDPALVYRHALGDGDIFRKIKEPVEVFPAVGVLVDESGSMHIDRRFAHARRAVIAVHEALKRLDIAHAVSGFTTDEDEKNHYVYSYLDFSNRHTTTASSRLAAISAREFNRDGLAVKIAADRLARRKEARRLLLIISDGLPNTLSYGGEEAVADTRRMVRMTEKRGLDVFCIYIGNEKENYIASIYRNYIFVRDVADLPLNLSRMITGYSRRAKRRSDF